MSALLVSAITSLVVSVVVQEIYLRRTENASFVLGIYYLLHPRREILDAELDRHP